MGASRPALSRAGVSTETPGVLGALAGENKSLRSCGATMAGEELGESSQSAVFVTVAGVGFVAACLGRCCVCGVAWMR